MLQTRPMPQAQKRLAQWTAGRFAERLWKKDPSLWGGDASTPELADRLGWLSLPADMPARLKPVEELASEIASEGFRHVVVLGMGGSSLAPEVFQRTFGNAKGRPQLLV